MIAGAVFSHPVIIQLFARFQMGLSANHALSVQSGSRRSVNPRILRRCWLGQATPGPRESSRSDPELNSSRLARRISRAAPPFRARESRASKPADLHAKSSELPMMPISRDDVAGP